MALEDALQRHVDGLLTVSGGAGGMHLSARLDVPVADTEVSSVGRTHGLVLRPLSRFCLPGTQTGYNGLVFGYGSVPASRMDPLAQQVRTVIQLALANRARRRE
jgi:GntR family transcriptional regulator/MocR family aminotransferase